jgi:hypothetical protein
LLSDDTIAFVDAAGEAFGVRGGVLRWRTRVGRAEGEHAAPLPLDDGGVVVATGHEVAVLDATGGERARTLLPEGSAFPLLSALGTLIAVSSNGAVWSWKPGSGEPARVGSFGTPIVDGAALVDDHTLVAVAANRTRAVSVDLARGASSTRSVAPGGLWLGPPATRKGVSYLLLAALTSDLAVAVDSAGAELFRATLATHPAAPPLDGGPPVLAAPPHTPLLVDGAGTIAFGTPDGSVGVASEAGAETLAGICPEAGPAASSGPAPSARPPPVVGMAPLAEGTLVAACASGALVALSGTRAHAR